MVMFRSQTIEESFSEEFLKQLNEHIQDEEMSITRSVLDHSMYAEKVGHIRGLVEARDSFTRLLKVFFPS